MTLTALLAADPAAGGDLAALCQKYCLCPSAWAVALTAAAVYLVVPPQSPRGRIAGTLLGALAIGLLAYDMPSLGEWGHMIVFWIAAGVALLAAGGTIVSRDPVYSALFFALSLMGTAGLFIFLGAQFLGVATIVVYAGAIVVTFLFVVMLAQPEGHAVYDRVSWGWFPKPAVALTSAILLALALQTLSQLDSSATADAKSVAANKAAERKAALRGQTLDKPTDSPSDVVSVRRVDANDVLSDKHMATLGAQLFSRHLIAVEVAGTLLLAALVGAVAIAIHGKNVARADGSSEAAT